MDRNLILMTKYIFLGDEKNTSKNKLYKYDLLYYIPDFLQLKKFPLMIS